MAVYSKKKNSIQKTTEDGYCRCCQKVMTLNDDNFYDATNPMLDKNGKMSICKKCCNNLYEDYFKIYNNVETSLKLTCQDLDVRFSKESLKQTQSAIENAINKGKTFDKVFGTYKSKLMSTGQKNDGVDSFRFKDSDKDASENILNIPKPSDLVFEESDFKVTENIAIYWGKGYEKEQYEFLENEIYKIKTDFECTDYGMEMIMKDICFINLEIEKIRQGHEKGDINKLIESRSKLMNDGNLKPVQSTGADKNEKLSLGVFIKKWENERPIKRGMDDEMKTYIDTYMVGHLAKMEGLNNDVVRKYEESIKEFTLDFNEIKNVEEDD